MKFADRIGALVIAFGLWMVLAFILGLLVRPVFNAFLTGFYAWGAL